MSEKYGVFKVSLIISSITGCSNSPNNSITTSQTVTDNSTTTLSTEKINTTSTTQKATAITTKKVVDNSTGKLLVVSYIDVGQADSILIQSPNGKNMLIDAGQASSQIALYNYLKGKGVKKIDILVATHPHADHIGGMAYAQLVRANSIIHKNILLSVYTQSKKTKKTALIVKSIEVLTLKSLRKRSPKKVANMYIENKNKAFTIMKYANIHETYPVLEKILGVAIIGHHKKEWCHIDDDLFWNKVLLKNINSFNFISGNKIYNLEELVVKYIQWDVDIKLEQKHGDNWMSKSYKNQ